MDVKCMVGNKLVIIDHDFGVGGSIGNSTLIYPGL